MAKLVDVYVEGLGPLLKDLRALPKEATAELRAASVVIAERHMVPSWRNAAMRAGNWGPKLAASIRAKKDRTPALQVGYQKKVYRGKASTNMVRYPSYRGTTVEGQPFAPFGDGTGWMATRRPYEQAAITEWGQAVDKIVRKWDTNT
jgi:hypothetical protein